MKKKSFSDTLDSHGFDIDFYEQGNKHKSMEGYDLKFHSDLGSESIFSSEEEDEYDISVCYVLWDNVYYVKYLYISLISQILFTDILKVSNIQIIVSENLYPLVLEVFEPFLDSDIDLNIKKYEHKTITRNGVTGQLYVNKLNKYVVTLLDDLDSEVLILSDCENFFYGKQTELYSNIWQSYKSDDEFPILGCKVYRNKSVFLGRREALSPLIYDDEEYINWFVKRLGVDKENFKNKMISRNAWYLTCFFVFDKEKFSADNKEWEEYINWCSQYSFYCDETVYLSYAECVGDYDIRDLSYIDNFRFVPSRECETFYNKNVYNRIGAFHPLHSGQRDDWIPVFYDELIERFDILVQKVSDKKSSIEQELPQY